MIGNRPEKFITEAYTESNKIQYCNKYYLRSFGWGFRGVYGVSAGAPVVPLQGGGRTLLRVAELHWSTCNSQPRLVTSRPLLYP